MANFCSECGAALAANARFCSECGVGVDGKGSTASMAPAPTPDSIEPVRTADVGGQEYPGANQPAQGIGQSHDEFYHGDDDHGHDHEEEVPKRAGMIWAGVAVIALAVAGGAWIATSTIGGEDLVGNPVTDKSSASQQASEYYYTVAKANVRDMPSLKGSRIIGSFDRGEKISGTTVTETDGRIWLKLAGEDRYISLANLSKNRPPELTTLDGSDRIVSGSCTLLEQASANSNVKTSLKKGAELKNFGQTADGFTEFGLPGGGVGYASPSAECTTSQSMAKGAVANQLIKFDPNTCEFGPELASYFEKAHQIRASQSEEYETEELTVPVDKLFHGLRVTTAISGYEWQGVAFAESADKVRSVFRQLGYELDAKGEFVVDPETPVSTSLSATDADTGKRGKSQLICGL